MENIYQHFRDNEREFIDLAMDWVQKAEFEFRPYLTHFLDPRQKYIVDTLVGQTIDVQVETFGGVRNAERKRALIFPDYYQPAEDDFGISVLEIVYPSKFHELKHGQILGTILGSGLKREMIGDILTDGKTWQVVVDKNIEFFLRTHIDRIGKAAVQLVEVSGADVLKETNEWNINTSIVSSLRLDAVLSGTLNLSRDKAKKLISSERVKINWSETHKPNIELETNDMVSIRGFGRIQLQEILGRTKKNKYLIEVGTLKSTR